MKTEAERLLEAKANELGRGMQAVFDRHMEGVEGQIAQVQQLKDQFKKYQAAQAEHLAAIDARIVEISDQVRAILNELQQAEVPPPPKKGK